MRTIKFRIFDYWSAKMIYPNYPNGNFNFYWFEENGFTEQVDSTQYELMQFTGLLDKNGKEIYEGDLLKNGGECPPAEVVFERGCFYAGQYGCELYRFAGDNKEIIGNTYENPELLK